VKMSQKQTDRASAKIVPFLGFTSSLICDNLIPHQ
jgi:hypothetical protein